MRKSRGVNTYSGAHRNLVLQRGLPTVHQCECGAPADEWAYTHDNPCPDERVQHGMEFSVDPDRYKALCRRCHRLYDKAHITHCPKRHAYEGDNLIWDNGKRKCRTCVYARNAERRKRTPMTPEQRARKSELQRSRRAKARAVRATA